jgi:hypothetical protein
MPIALHAVFEKKDQGCWYKYQRTLHLAEYNTKNTIFDRTHFFSPGSNKEVFERGGQRMTAS